MWRVPVGRKLRGKRPDPNLREDGEEEPAKELEKVAREIKETLAKYRALEAPKAGGPKESTADSINGYGGEAGCGLRRDMGSQDHQPLPPLTPSSFLSDPQLCPLSVLSYPLSVPQAPHPNAPHSSPVSAPSSSLQREGSSSF